MARNKKPATPAKQSLIDLANKQLAREKKTSKPRSNAQVQMKPKKSTRFNDKITVYNLPANSPTIFVNLEPAFYIEKYETLCNESPTLLLLHEAVKNNDTNEINLIIKYGVHLNTFNKIGLNSLNQTPLHKAIWANTTTFETMLAYTLNINVKDNEGNTPLHLAADLDCPDYIEKLIERGADIYLRNNQKLMALDVAKKESSTKSIQLLTKKMESDLEVKLIQYIAKRNNEDMPTYLNSIKLFSLTLGFGFSKHKKINAAKALLKKIQTHSNDALTEYLPALNNGELKKLYANYLAIHPKTPSQRFVK